MFQHPCFREILEKTRGCHHRFFPTGFVICNGMPIFFLCGCCYCGRGQQACKHRGPLHKGLAQCSLLLFAYFTHGRRLCTHGSTYTLFDDSVTVEVELFYIFILEPRACSPSGHSLPRLLSSPPRHFSHLDSTRVAYPSIHAT
jgi:hypothetical protein